MKKLSKTQQDVVDALNSGVRIIYMRYMGTFNPSSYYYREDTYKRVTSAVKRLLDLGVVEKTKKSYGDHEIGLKSEETK